MATIKKRTGNRLFTAIIAVVMLCTLVATTAFAKNISNFTWLQSTSKKTIELGQMYPGSNINTSGISYYFVATSPQYGEFSVVLQRKGFLGIWQNVDGNAAYRTAQQSSEWKYDPRNNEYVNEQVNLFSWPTNQSGEYRIIMENATAPQATVFTNVEAWAYGSN